MNGDQMLEYSLIIPLNDLVLPTWSKGKLFVSIWSIEIEICYWDEGGWEAEELPLCALADDRVVEVQGDPRHVQRAMELVVSHLRKFLVDRSVLPLFELNVSTLFC